MTENTRRLEAAVQRLHQVLEARQVGQTVAFDGSLGARQAGQAIAFDGGVETPLALEQLALRFGLTDFERDVLQLCVACDRSAQLAQRLRGDARASGYVDFDRCHQLLLSPDRAALSPVGPLRRWRLIELAAAPSLDQARLILDERVRFYLEGHSFLDPRLEGLVQPITTPPKEDAAVLESMAHALHNISSPSQCPVIELSGALRPDREAVFTAACRQLQLQPYQLCAADIPGQPAEREALARLWEREAMLLDAALLIDAETLHEDQAPRLKRFLGSLEALVFVSSSARLPPLNRRVVACELTPREPHAEVERWRTALGSFAKKLNGSVERTASQFRLDDQALAHVAAAVRSARQFCGDDASLTHISAAANPARQLIPEAPALARVVAVHSVNQVELGAPALAHATGTPRSASADHSLAQVLWDSARERARHGLDALAERIESRAGWDDLVLPGLQVDVLKTLAIQVRERDRVYRQWGFADKSTRGLGIAALFAGASGTGKTLAAEVLANELRLDLYRIDLARLVSKYIGDTEKNLARVFAAAEASGAILLFDEADALFGKRSEVRDSHDRYANIEVSYLLQRIESYRGLSILTTNLKQAIDQAFMRRIRFIVQFPFPEATARRDIWARVFPAAVPREAIDLDKLARLNLAGGYIRNIALNAAFLAADKNEAVRMSHLRSAAEAEYAKLERPLPRAEVGDWA